MYIYIYLSDTWWAVHHIPLIISTGVCEKKQSSCIPAGERPSNPAPHISMFRCRAAVDCLCEKKQSSARAGTDV